MKCLRESYNYRDVKYWAPFVLIGDDPVGTAYRSVSGAKEKWTNLQRTAKNELSKFRKEQRKTGGGPPPKLPSKGTDKILELLKDTPSFSGLQGFETGWLRDDFVYF